jgi:hypothetical protein
LTEIESSGPQLQTILSPLASSITSFTLELATLHIDCSTLTSCTSLTVIDALFSDMIDDPSDFWGKMGQIQTCKSLAVIDVPLQPNIVGGSLKDVTSLCIQHSNISRNDLGLMANSICSFSALQTLDFNCTNKDDYHEAVIDANLHLPVTLSKCIILGGVPATFLAKLNKCTALQFLRVSHVENDHLSQIIKSTSLQHLIIDWSSNLDSLLSLDTLPYVNRLWLHVSCIKQAHLKELAQFVHVQKILIFCWRDEVFPEWLSDLTVAPSPDDSQFPFTQEELESDERDKPEVKEFKTRH